MRIVHIETGRNWLGGPAQVVSLMEGLAARGHSGLLVCPAGSEVGRRAASEGLDVREVAFAGDVDPRLFLGCLAAIRSFDPDLVHLHSRRGADTHGAWAARRLGKPVVLSRRVDYPLRDSPALRRRYTRAYDHVIAISEAIRRVLIAGGIPADHVTTVHDGVDVHQYRQAPEAAGPARVALGVPSDAPLFAIAAHMIHRKGHDVLWEAVARLSPDAPTMRVAVFGKGEEEGRLRALASELGIKHHLVWAGFRNDLPDLLPGIDCLVHPARLEGLGVAVLQALACGKPVIACPVGGIPEAVRPPLDGWLVPVEDPAALAAAMREAMGNPADATARGAAGRALVEAEFSVDAMVDGNLAVYENVLAKHPRPQGERV